MSLIDGYKQYGWKIVPRLIKSAMRRAGIQFEIFYLLECELSAAELRLKMEKYDFSDVRELTISDLETSSFFTPGKIEMFRERLSSGEYSCYGLISENEVIYSTWISWKTMGYPTYFKRNETLENNKALLEDSFCHPKYRGTGIHSRMNLFRMFMILERGCTSVLALVLKENSPALKVQLKSGFKLKKKISFIRIGNWKKIKETIVNGSL